MRLGNGKEFDGCWNYDEFYSWSKYKSMNHIWNSHTRYNWKNTISLRKRKETTSRLPRSNLLLEFLVGTYSGVRSHNIKPKTKRWKQSLLLEFLVNTYSGVRSDNIKPKTKRRKQSREQTTPQHLIRSIFSSGKVRWPHYTRKWGYSKITGQWQGQCHSPKDKALFHCPPARFTR